MNQQQHSVCVTITTGRSGSTFLHNVFRYNYPQELGIFHESLHPGKAKPATYHRLFDGSAIIDEQLRGHLDEWDRLLEQGPVVDFGWILGGLAPALLRRYGERLKVLVLTAHPVSVAASFANRGHYTVNRNPAWAISPFHERVAYPGYRSRWARMTPFEKCLYRWLEITRLGIDFPNEFPEVPTKAVLSHDVFANPATAESIASLIGFEARALSYDVDRNESAENHVERRPIGYEWKRVFDMIEVVDLAQTLGFDMSETTVEAMVSRYRPKGFLPRLRHATGYWAAREIAGRIAGHLRGRDGD